MNKEEYDRRCEGMGLAHPIPTPMQALELMTAERDSLLRQVEELRAEVSRLSQIAKY
jgi:hypothetical protein